MHVVSLDLLAILILATGIIALVDAIVRLSGRGRLLPIIELVAGVLLALSVFIDLPHFLGRTIMQVVLEIVLILLLFVRRGVRRGGIALTILALVLNTVLILVSLHWITIPSIGLG